MDTLTAAKPQLECHGVELVLRMEENRAPARMTWFKYGLCQVCGNRVVLRARFHPRIVPRLR